MNRTRSWICFGLLAFAALSSLSAGCGKATASADEKAMEWERTTGREQRQKLEGTQPTK